MTDTPLTPGNRLYLIRLACGDGIRKPESQAKFVERVEAATGVRFDASAISVLETGNQKFRLEDIEAFASVDPMKRGPAWLAFGVVEDPQWRRVEPKNDTTPAASQESKKRVLDGGKSRRR